MRHKVKELPKRQLAKKSLLKRLLLLKELCRRTQKVLSKRLLRLRR